MKLLAGRTVPTSATSEGAAIFRRKMPIAAGVMRHQFAIEPLGKLGSFRSQPYLYSCVRCSWMFRINDPRGSIIALDGLGRHLLEPENTKRSLTFHHGPCSAFPNVECLEPEPRHSITLTKLAGFLSRVVSALRIPHSRKVGKSALP